MKQMTLWLPQVPHVLAATTTTRYPLCKTWSDEERTEHASCLHVRRKKVSLSEAVTLVHSDPSYRGADHIREHTACHPSACNSLFWRGGSPGSDSKDDDSRYYPTYSLSKLRCSLTIME
jgi:hypothetical protein